MKIAIMGSGGVGGYFGALLARSGQEVYFIARGEHLNAMIERGLKVRSVIDSFDLSIRPPGEVLDSAASKPEPAFAFATSDPRTIGRADAVFFCVKTYDTESASKQILPMVGPQTIILPLQNGIDAADKGGRDHGRNHLLAGAAYIYSALSEPGVITQSGGPRRIVFGELDGSISKRAQTIHEIFDQAGFPNEISTNIRKTSWEKFAMICANGGMSALTRATLGEMMENTHTRSMLEKTMKEVVTVGAAEGVPLDSHFIDKTMKFLESLEPDGRASMYTDLVNGRRLELESLNGKVVHLAKTHGIPVPMNFAIYAALAPHMK